MLQQAIIHHDPDSQSDRKHSFPYSTLLKFGEEKLILVVGELGEWRDGRTEESEGV